MIERQVTARPVDTFVQQSTAGVQAAEQRQRQVHGVLDQLGVVTNQYMARRNKEDDEKAKAASRLQAKTIAADLYPQMTEALNEPGTLDGTFEEFANSDLYSNARKAFEAIGDEDVRREFLDAMDSTVSSSFVSNKEKRQYQQLVDGGSRAQEASAALGVDMQIDAYKESLTAGIKEDDAFTSALAVAVLQSDADKDYLDKFASAHDWTPEQRLQIEKQQASMQKKHDSEVTQAIMLAGKEEDNTRKFETYASLLERYGSRMTDSQRDQVMVELQYLPKVIQREHQVAGMLGSYTAQELADGAGVAPGGANISIGEIRKIQNRAATNALASGNTGALMRLMAIPGDEPSVLKSKMGAIIGSLAVADPNNTAVLNNQVGFMKVLEQTLGHERVRGMLSARDYEIYRSLTAVEDIDQLPSAVSRVQKMLELQGTGEGITPKNWAKDKREVLEYTVDLLKDIDWSFRENKVDEGVVAATLSAHFNEWRTLQLSLDEMKSRAAELVEQSSWNGMLNGKRLQQSLEAMTYVDGGNPYDEDAEGLFEKYKELKLKDIRQTQDGVGEIVIRPTSDPNRVYIESPDGIPIAGGVTSVKDIVSYLKANVKTRMEKIKENGR